jgi:hypothetical protein
MQNGKSAEQYVVKPGMVWARKKAVAKQPVSEGSEEQT